MIDRDLEPAAGAAPQRNAPGALPLRGLGDRWLVGIRVAAPGIAASFAFGLLGWWSRRQLEWPFPEVAVAVACLVVYLLGVWSTRSWSASGVRRGMILAVLAALAGLLIYAYAWNRYTDIVFEEGNAGKSERRVILGRYQPQLQADLALAEERGLPIPSIQDILRDKAWKIDEVFTHESRAAVATVLEIAWLGAGAGLMWLIAVAAAPRPRDVSLADLRTRTARLAPALPEKVGRELHRALDTLEKADNAPDTLTCISRVFEGKDGLLAVVFHSREEDVVSSLAAKNNKEEKELRGRLARESFGALDLMDQIEILRVTRILRRMQASDLHWIRVHRNDPGAHGGDLDRRRALIALEFALDLAESYARGTFGLPPHV